jgi:uncharacterized protein
MSSTNKRTTLITGASAGIGKEFARELAKDGFDLVLTARRLDKLTELKDELEKQYGIDVMVISRDLANPDTPKELFEELMAANKKIDFLVNNAGYGNAKTFLDTSWDSHASFIQVMLTALCELTHLFLPAMVENGYGRVVNVASVAGFMPGTNGDTLYGAVKSCIIKFTESLSLELEGTGVLVSALCPGFTYSEFHDVANTRATLKWIPGFMWMDANTVARKGIDAVNQGKVVYVDSLVYQFIVSAVTRLPQKTALLVSRSRSKLET